MMLLPCVDMALPLTPELCAELTAPPTDSTLTERERCSVCDMMVTNAEAWGWQGHYDALCTGMPSHAEPWVCICFTVATN